MRTLALRGDAEVEVVDVDEPAWDPAAARVRIEATALCGSEVGAFRQGRPSGNLGHEAVGIVEHVPDGHGVTVGQRVGISGLRGCNHCAECAVGREMRCAAVRPQLDLHAEVVSVAPWTLRAVPESIEPAEAVLLTGDALGVPMRALNKVPSLPGARVVVLGLGPVGLSHVLVRLHAGAEVVAIEPSLYRRELAARLGAKVLAPGGDTPPAPLVIEATGIPDVVRSAFPLATPGGTVLQSGECAAVELQPSAQVVHREVTYRGTWFYGAEDYPSMVGIVQDGLALRHLITHELPAADAQAGVTAMCAGESGKVVLRWA